MKEAAPVHIALDWIASTPRLQSVASCWQRVFGPYADNGIMHIDMLR